MMKNSKTTPKTTIREAELPLSLFNELCLISYDPVAKEICGKDLGDQHNLPRFFNRSKRGLPAAWKVLCAAFNDQMSMHVAAPVLDSCGINVHCYCSMD